MAKKDAFRGSSLDTSRVLRDTYSIGPLLGEGGYGKVYAARLQARHRLFFQMLRGCSEKKERLAKLRAQAKEFRKNHTFPFACKITPFKDRTSTEWEVKMLGLCQHRYIANFLELLVSPESNFLLMIRYYGSADKRLLGMGTYQERIRSAHANGCRNRSYDSTGSGCGDKYDDGSSRSRSLTVAAWTSQLLQALSHIHGLGIIHRDVKPNNLLCTSPRSSTGIVLADFGLAEHEEQPRNPAKLSGTSQFFAPELWRRGVQTRAADVWAAGVTAYLMVVGKHPVPEHELYQDAPVQQFSPLPGTKGSSRGRGWVKLSGSSTSDKIRYYCTTWGQNLVDGLYSLDFAHTSIKEAGLGKALQKMLKPARAKRASAASLVVCLRQEAELNPQSGLPRI